MIREVVLCADMPGAKPRRAIPFAPGRFLQAFSSSSEQRLQKNRT